MAGRSAFPIDGASMDLTALDVGLRWMHFIAGIVWIGHNYVNVVARPTFQPLSPAELGDEASERFMALLAREHGVFRYASIVTWLAGVLLLWRQGRLLEAAILQGFSAVIGVGLWIGTVMMLNVWLVMWPHQKKVLGFVPASVEERIRCARIAFLSSRVNTMLSLPLLFFMAASSHGISLFA